MKCSIKLHFIWVFTVGKSTHLGVSSIQRANQVQPIFNNFTSLISILGLGLYFSFCPKLTNALQATSGDPVSLRCMSVSHKKGN